MAGARAFSPAHSLVVDGSRCPAAFCKRTDDIKGFVVLPGR
jgi:hypothetical protein